MSRDSELQKYGLTKLYMQSISNWIHKFDFKVHPSQKLIVLTPMKMLTLLHTELNIFVVTLTENNSVLGGFNSPFTVLLS